MDATQKGYAVRQGQRLTSSLLGVPAYCGPAECPAAPGSKGSHPDTIIVPSRVMGLLTGDASSPEPHAQCPCPAGARIITKAQSGASHLCPEQRTLCLHCHFPGRKLRGSAVTREARGGGFSEAVAPGGAERPHGTWKGGGYRGTWPGSQGLGFSLWRLPGILTQEAAILGIYIHTGIKEGQEGRSVRHHQDQ